MLPIFISNILTISTSVQKIISVIRFSYFVHRSLPSEIPSGHWIIDIIVLCIKILDKKSDTRFLVPAVRRNWENYQI